MLIKLYHHDVFIWREEFALCGFSFLRHRTIVHPPTEEWIDPKKNLYSMNRDPRLRVHVISLFRNSDSWELRGLDFKYGPTQAPIHHANKIPKIRSLKWRKTQHLDSVEKKIQFFQDGVQKIKPFSWMCCCSSPASICRFPYFLVFLHLRFRLCLHDFYTKMGMHMGKCGVRNRGYFPKLNFLFLGLFGWRENFSWHPNNPLNRGILYGGFEGNV